MRADNKFQPKWAPRSAIFHSPHSIPSKVIESVRTENEMFMLTFRDRRLVAIISSVPESRPCVLLFLFLLLHCKRVWRFTWYTCSRLLLYA